MMVLLPVTLATIMGDSLFPGRSTSDPGPGNGVGKAMEDSLFVWVPVTYVGDPDSAPGS